MTIASSDDQARQVLTGVHVYNLKGKLVMVATDSYRLAEKNLGPIKNDISLLVPASAMQDLLRIVSNYDDDVVVKHDDQQVLFKAGDVELVTRLIEGQYPDYRKLVPQKLLPQPPLAAPIC